MKKFTLLSIVIIGLQFSCQNTPKPEQKLDSLSHAIYKENIHKVIQFPPIDQANNDNDRLKEAFKKDDNYKILSVFNLGCSSCLETITQWRELKLKEGVKKVKVLFIIRPEVMHYLDELVKEHFFEGFNLYIDKTDFFSKRNEILQKTQFSTVLLDKDNKIVLIGDPIKNKAVGELYLKVLEKEH